MHDMSISDLGETALLRPTMSMTGMTLRDELERMANDDGANTG